MENSVGVWFMPGELCVSRWGCLLIPQPERQWGGRERIIIILYGSYMGLSDWKKTGEIQMKQYKMSQKGEIISPYSAQVHTFFFLIKDFLTVVK